MLDYVEEKSINIDSPETLAKYFVYIESSTKSNVAKVKWVNISGKGFYSKHKKIFDKFFEFSDKYSLDLKAYVKFTVNVLKCTRGNFESIFKDANTLNSFYERAIVQENNFKIYGYFQKSVKNIVKDCLAKGYTDVRDYLLELAETDKLAAKCFSGEISRYYLASLKDFKKLYDKLGQISKDELQIVLDCQDKYATDVQNAFLFVKSVKINPVQYTNKTLALAINKIQNEK